MITVEELERLWFRDKADKMEKPSIDRIDADGHYTFANCRYIELRDNVRRGRRQFTVTTTRRKPGRHYWNMVPGRHPKQMCRYCGVICTVWERRKNPIGQCNSLELFKPMVTK